jgi:hypothetical protein
MLVLEGLGLPFRNRVPLSSIAAVSEVHFNLPPQSLAKQLAAVGIRRDQRLRGVATRHIEAVAASWTPNATGRGSCGQARKRTARLCSSLTVTAPLSVAGGGGEDVPVCLENSARTELLHEFFFGFENRLADMDRLRLVGAGYDNLLQKGAIEVGGHGVGRGFFRDRERTSPTHYLDLQTTHKMSVSPKLKPEAELARTAP